MSHLCNLQHLFAASAGLALSGQLGQPMVAVSARHLDSLGSHHETTPASHRCDRIVAAAACAGT